MTDETVPPLDRALAMFAEMYPHPPMTKERMGVFRFALQDLTEAEINRALRSILAEPKRQFFPTSGEIRAAARPEPSAVELALLFDDVAWAVLGKRFTLARIEVYFGCDVGAAVVAVGGLPTFRNLDQHNNRPHVLKAFTAVMLECHHNPELARFGAPPQQRAAEIVAETAKKLKLIGGGKS